MESTPTTPTDTQLSAFASDVLNGLSQHPKRLSSRYFYDAKGDALFQQIMGMPEYYLTDCELDVFQTHKEAILRTIGADRFHLIELGAGDGLKTKVLLEHFLNRKIDFAYQPIDISGNILEELKASLHQRWPNLQVEPQAGDYFEMLHQITESSDTRNVVLFLGANIGNYPADAARQFLLELHNNLNPGDLLLIGIDLKKDPEVILNAYNDAQGITAAFNLNLLTRINRELGGNFELSHFRHWETYDPVSGATRSFLVSEKEQHVFIHELNRSFHFDAWEAIQVELSQKYSLREIAELATATGFEVVTNFTDQKGFFVDSLWQVPQS
jgi:dimethylhistidine N-methyltransferase